MEGIVFPFLFFLPQQPDLGNQVLDDRLTEAAEVHPARTPEAMVSGVVLAS